MASILIIDDDPTTRLLLQRNLERQGYVVKIANDGQEGVALAQELRPALVICDWMMPEKDGLEVCRILKSDPTLSTTFFVLLTARTDVEDRVQGLDAGADEFLTKPIDANELQARVRAGLRLHQLSWDLQKQTEQLRSELNQAANYVRSLLPPAQIFADGQVETDWVFIPSQELGGDCFNYHWLDAETLAVYLLDVSGHGVGAALLSVSLINLLRSQSFSVDFKDPAAVLQELNANFQMSEQNELYFTMWYGTYHLPTRTLSYSSAGHPPGLLITSSDPEVTVTTLKTPNLPIGMIAEIKFQSAKIKIPSNSELYLFSDGIYEITNASGELWGLQAFSQSLCQLKGIAQDNLDHIIKVAQSFSSDQPFMDDVSIVRLWFG